MQVFIQAQSVCLGILFLSVFIPVRLSRVYHIVPTMLQNSNCSHCITLSQFADDPTRYASGPTELEVTHGNHSLDKDISVFNIEHFSIYLCRMASILHLDQ